MTCIFNKCIHRHQVRSKDNLHVCHADMYAASSSLYAAIDSFYPVPIHRGTGYFFDRFLCIFVSLLARLRENCWTDLHEIFREGAEWPWDDLIQFGSNRRNRAMPRCATRGRGLLCFRTTACFYLKCSSHSQSQPIMRISVSVIDVVAAENIWNILQLRETTLAALILNKLKIWMDASYYLTKIPPILSS